jgi:hypothetical protein
MYNFILSTKTPLTLTIEDLPKQRRELPYSAYKSKVAILYHRNNRGALARKNNRDFMGSKPIRHFQYHK